MSINSLQKQTNINIQEKANLICEIAIHIVWLFKPHEYGKVILPMTLLKRFDGAFAPTKQAVVDMWAEMKVEVEARDGVLCNTSGYSFYNTSRFDFKKLVSDPDNIESNFENYLQDFSSNVKDIVSNFKFVDQVRTMTDGNVLFVVIQEFISAKGDMSPDKITSAEMEYIFEELIGNFLKAMTNKQECISQAVTSSIL